MQKALALVAIVFGVATVAAGGRVLLGSDPGYVVYRPLLLFNTLMGFGYIAAGLLMWRRAETGKRAAAIIFALNLLVLLFIGYQYAAGTAVAVDSLRAMTLRTVVWLALLGGLVWMTRGRGADGTARDAR